MRAASFLAPIGLVVVSGCLPSRDNPHDPAIAPVASLVVIERPRVGGLCPEWAELADSDVGTEVVSISRGRCLALDASGSNDPQGIDTVTCTFHQVDRADEDGVIVGAVPVVMGEDPDDCVATLDSAYRLSLTPNIPLHFEVLVDDGRSKSRAWATLVLENSPPLAVADPPRSFPLLGLPWRGNTHQVPFYGNASTDPDGDPLTYCWSFLPSGESVPQGPFCRAEDDPPVLFGVSLTSATQLGAFLEVRDQPLLTGVRDTTRVTVGKAGLWAAPDGEGPFQRIDTERDEVGAGMSPVDPNESIIPALAPACGPKGCLLSVHDYVPGGATRENMLVLRTTDEPDVKDFVAIGEGFVEVLADPDDPRVWTHVDEYDVLAGCSGIGADTSSTVTSWTVAPDLSLVEGPCTWLSWRPDGEFFLPGLVDGASRVWFVDAVSGKVSVVEPDGNVTDEVNTIGGMITGLAIRPESSATNGDEVWAIWRQALTTTDPPESLRILRWNNTEAPTLGSLEQILYDPGVAVFPNAVALEWISPDEFWVLVPDDGLYRVDAARFLDARSFQEAAIVVANEVIDGLSLSVDPVTGAAWVGSETTFSVYRVELDGTVTRYEREPGARIRFVDDSGLLYYSAPGRLATARSPNPDGVTAEILLLGKGGAVPDLDRGTAWVGSLLPPAIVQFAEDGTIVSYFTEALLSFGGGPPALVPISPVTELRFSQGHGVGWAFVVNVATDTLAGLSRADVSTGSPIVVTPVLGVSSVRAIFFNGLVFEPTAAPNDFAWVVLSTNGALVTRMGTEGLLDLSPDVIPGNYPGAQFSLPATELTLLEPYADAGFSRFIRGAADLATGDLCLATHDETIINNTTDEIVVRRFPADGTPPTTGRITVPMSPTNQPGRDRTELVAVAATEEECWVAWNESDQDPSTPLPTQYRIASRRASDGLPSLNFAGAPGEITSMVPVLRDFDMGCTPLEHEIWITRRSAAGVSTVQIEPTMPCGNILQEGAVLAPSPYEMKLVAPGSTSRPFGAQE